VGQSDPLEASRALLACGVELAIVKLGREGVMARTPERVIEMDAIPVKVVNGLGAGDAFGGACGLVAGHIPLERSITERTRASGAAEGAAASGHGESASASVRVSASPARRSPGSSSETCRGRSRHSDSRSCGSPRSRPASTPEDCARSVMRIGHAGATCVVLAPVPSSGFDQLARFAENVLRCWSHIRCDDRKPRTPLREPWRHGRLPPGLVERFSNVLRPDCSAVLDAADSFNTTHA
jgi:hypothetical protein